MSVNDRLRVRTADRNPWQVRGEAEPAGGEKVATTRTMARTEVVRRFDW